MRKRLIWMAPAAILGMVIFCLIGGEVVMRLWNWLAPTLFGFRQITFWQALGLLALCRILFGGFGLGGGGSHRSKSRRGMRERVSARVSERMAERWEQMTPEERERLRQGIHGRDRRTTPLDSNPSA
ncbi:MAG TPA: hypothetical protein VK582_18560 [Pyrinomonadaceae bacterium]|nr:hypothetical protein [Pyrinomonadaceae bacterium]